VSFFASPDTVVVKELYENCELGNGISVLSMRKFKTFFRLQVLRQGGIVVGEWLKSKPETKLLI